MKICCVVKGGVQGVFFRHYTKKKADELGLKGFVRNLPDVTVEVVAEGSEKKIREFKEWLRKGPSSARVEELVFKKPVEQSFPSFSIL